MKILLLGSTGKVGRRLARSLPRVGETIVASRASVDLAEPDAIRAAIRSIQPDVVLNAAGYTNVDRAESQHALAHAVNAVAPEVMAEEARRIGALLVQFSSVYVFDGTKQGAYSEDDAPRPVNEYGRSKLRGEQAIIAAGGLHLILRASWVYDTGGRDDFVLAMLRLAAERETLRVVDDQFGSPTSAVAIADATCQMLSGGRAMSMAPGIYNLAALGAVNRADFTSRLLERTRALRRSDAPAVLEPIKTAEFPLPATRPLNSVLDSGKIVSAGVRLSSWQEQLDEFASGLLRSR